MNSLLKASLVVMPLLLFVNNAFAEDEFQPAINHFVNGEYLKAYAEFDLLQSNHQSSSKSNYKSNAEFQYYYGLSSLLTGNSKLAIEAMEQAIELEPNNANYHYALSKVYEVRAQEVNPFSAIRMIKRYKLALLQAVELNPYYISASRDLTTLLLGWPQFLGGDKTAGQTQLEKLAELDQPTAYLAEAIALSEDKDAFELTEKLLLLAINTNTPESSVGFSARISLAELYVKHEQYSKALPFLHQSLELPRTWSEPFRIFMGPMLLAVSYYFLEDDINFRKYALIAEQASVTLRDQESLKKRLKGLKVRYGF